MAELQQSGTTNAICNGRMREKAPRTGLGFVLTLLIFVAGAIIVLKSLIEKIPRP